MAERIGIYGGTFDPPHLGHLVVADRVLTEQGLDGILFIPCRTPPLKPAASATGPQRLAMVEAMVASRPEFGVSCLELEREGISYTVDTLETLAAERPAIEWTLILGADAFYDFVRWYRYERILELASLAVVNRPGVGLDETLHKLPAVVRERTTVVPMPLLDVASRTLRAEMAAGRSVRYLVPEPVWLFIRKHQLYRGA